MIDAHYFYSFLNIVPSDDLKAIIDRLFCDYENGHTYIDLDDRELSIVRAFPEIIQENNDAPFVLSNRKLFIGKIWDMEKRCAQILLDKSKNLCIIDNQDISDFFAQNFDQNNQEQALAAALSVLHYFTWIGGGPGTGKTTVAGKVLSLLQQTSAKPLRIALAAPTGKAASHLQQSLKKNNIHIEGKTLHRLLGITMPSLKAKYNAHHYLPYDVIIVDEASMIDLELFHALLQAISAKCRLILLGDNQQLPSVGVGSILASLVRENIVSIQEKLIIQKWLSVEIRAEENPLPLSSCIVKLTKSHRFDESNGIGKLAQAVLYQPQEIENCFSGFDNLKHKKTILEWMEEYWQLQQNYWSAVKEKNLDKIFAEFYRAITLCVFHYDADYFNEIYLQFVAKKLNFCENFFSGRALMITQNMPTLDLYNGEIGIVINDDSGINVFFEDYSGKYRSFSIDQLGNYENAFAITVHKSQGSEFISVALIQPQEDIHQLYDRSLLYTAITRARNEFIAVGDVNKMIGASYTHRTRRSALADFLECHYSSIKC